MNLTKIKAYSKELDVNGDKVSKTHLPSQWAIAYGFFMLKEVTKSSVKSKTLQEYVFEGVLVQHLDDMVDRGELLVTWDEETNSFKYASPKLDPSGNYNFVSLRDIYASVSHNFV